MPVVGQLGLSLLLRAKRHSLELYIKRFMPTASRKAGPPTLWQKVGAPVIPIPYNREVMAFADASETLLKPEREAVKFTQQQNQVIQYYLAALGVKFPAL